MTDPGRRRFLLGAAGAAIVAACTPSSDDGQSPTSTAPTTTRPDPIGPYPFSLGVASGDPDDTSVVLWTASDRPGDLTVEVARSNRFDSVEFAAPVELGDALTGRLLATGLSPDTTYWYRFWLDGHSTPPARTRTAPAAGARPDFTLAHLACQRYSEGYWTALADVADQAPDVVVHCGDYIYEVEGGAVRPVDTVRPTDLDGYRAIWRRYKAEPELQAAHAVAPWLMTWDDHEVENNYQGDDADRAQDTFLERRDAAYRAWWEFTPTRVAPPVVGESFVMYRTVDWGDAARITLLDTRQFRDDQPCGDDFGPKCGGDPSMLGETQEAWATDAIEQAAARWNVVVSGTVVHEWRLLPGNVAWNLDQWDGYELARGRLLTSLAQRSNGIVLSGDVHSSWAADLIPIYGTDMPVVGAEFVTPGTSSGVPTQLASAARLLRAQSPHIHYGEATRRGRVLHRVTEDAWTAEYRLVDDVTVPDAPIRVDATLVVEDGVPGL